jgi:hypothetical protein
VNLTIPCAAPLFAQPILKVLLLISLRSSMLLPAPLGWLRYPMPGDLPSHDPA